MAVGYEARARITADVSGFVAAQRQMAQATGTATAALRNLNRELRTTQQLAQASSSAMRPFTRQANQSAQANQTAARSAREGASAMQNMASAYNEGATSMQRNVEQQRRQTQASQQNARSTRANEEAQRSSTTTLRSMAREIVNTDRSMSQLRRAMDMGLNTNGQLDASYTSLRQRLQELRQRYEELSRTQQQAVRSQMNLITAQREATQASRESDQAARRMNTQRMEEVRIASRAAESTREAGRATQTYSQSSDAAERASREFTGSLWSMRSAVQDVGGSMMQLWTTQQRVTSALWENFSAQEMTIAQIARVSQATTTEMDAITASVRQMSTEIPIAFDELGRITMLGSQIGIANEHLEIFTETVALFSATSEVSADETASLMARIMEMTNLSQERGQESVQNLGSSVAYLGSNMVATDHEILRTIESIATMTTQAGMTAEATTGLGAAMASLRIRPEIARGASQRVFLELSSAVDGTSSAMESLVEMTGYSQTELQGMRDENFDQFFMTIMESLNGAYEAGADLVPLLRQLGIQNSRDAEVVARLSANYNVLESAMTGAHGAFEDGNYLYAESERIFNTLTARVEILRNTWNNFLFTAVEAIAPFITSVVEAATAAIEFADSIGAAPVLGWSAVILATVGTVGLLSSGIAQLSVGMLAIRGLMNMLSGSTATAAAAMGTHAAATTTATASQAAYQTTLMRTVSWGSAATTSVLATSSAMGVLAASTRTAAASMGAMALANPVLLIAGITTALVAASTQWGVFSDQTERAEQQVLKANDAHINAAGGLDALRQALEQDTEAWRGAQEQAHAYINDLDSHTSAFSSSAEEITRNSRFRMVAARDMSEADREAAEEAEGLSERQKDLRENLGITSDSFYDTTEGADALGESTQGLANDASEADNSIGKVNQTMSNSTEELENNAYAVGLASRQWAALSLESAVAESEILKNAEAFEYLEDVGVDLGAALTMEMNAAGDGAEYLRGKAAEIRTEFSTWDTIVGTLNDFTDNMVWDGWRPFTTDAIEASKATNEFADNLDASTLSINEAATATELLEGAFVKLPDGTRASAEQLAVMSEEGAEAAATANLLETEASALGVTIETLREGFSSFIDPLGTWQTHLEEAGLESDNFNFKLSELEGGFGGYLEQLEESQRAQMNWAQNLLTIADEVPPHVLGGLSEMGIEGASLVQGLVDATDEEVDRFVELWDAGNSDATDSFSVMFSDFMAMAHEAGDTGGVDFVLNLLDQVAAGDISFREAVDQMTAYAEEEFENSNPEATAHLDNTQAMKDLQTTIENLIDQMERANPTAKADVDTSGAWNSLTNWVSSAKDWLSRQSLSITTRLLTRGFSDGGPVTAAPSYSTGGWINGPGGPREDRIPAMVSDGEFIVNAKASREFGPLLEWINNGGEIGNVGSSVMAPSFVPDNVMNAPSVPLPTLKSMMPSDIAGAMQTGSQAAGPRIVVNINNHYPQAEPTSVTTNRALQYAAALDGLS